MNPHFFLSAGTVEERNEWIYSLKQGIEMFARETKFYKSQTSKDNKPPSSPVPAKPQLTSNLADISLIPLPFQEDIQKEQDEIWKLLETDDNEFLGLDLAGGYDIHENAYYDVALELLLWEEKRTTDEDLIQEFQTAFENTLNTPFLPETDSGSFEGNRSPTGQFYSQASIDSRSYSSLHNSSSQQSSPLMGTKQEPQTEKRRSLSHDNPSCQPLLGPFEEQEKTRTQSSGLSKAQSNWKKSNYSSQQKHIHEEDKQTTQSSLPRSLEQHSKDSKAKCSSTKYPSLFSLSNDELQATNSRFSQLPKTQNQSAKVSDCQFKENPRPLSSSALLFQPYASKSVRTSTRFRLTQDPNMFQKFKEITGGSIRSSPLKLSIEQKAEMIKFFNQKVPNVNPLTAHVNDHELEKEFFRNVIKAYPIAKYFGATEIGTTPTLPQILMNWVHWSITTHISQLPKEYKKPVHLSKDFASGVVLNLLVVSLNPTRFFPQINGTELEIANRSLEWAKKLGCPLNPTPTSIIEGNPLVALYLLTSLFYLYFPKQQSLFEEQVALPRETLCGILNHLFHFYPESETPMLNCFNLITRLRDCQLLCILINNTFFQKVQIEMNGNVTDYLDTLFTYSRKKGIYFPTTNLSLLQDDNHFISVIFAVTRYCLINRLSNVKYPLMAKLAPKAQYDPSPETKIVAWVNYHTKANISNLASDLSDGIVLTRLITKLFPETCLSLGSTLNHLEPNEAKNHAARRCKAIAVALQNALELRIPPLIFQKENASLNLLVLILVFQCRPQLHDSKQLKLDCNEQRKERSLRVWINSFQLEKNVKQCLPEKIRVSWVLFLI